MYKRQQQIPGLRDRLLGGPVDPQQQVVDLLPASHQTQRALGLVQPVRQRDTDPLVAPETVGPPEQAVPQARDLLVAAVRSMSVQDAKAVLTGGDDSATRYFETRTRTPLDARFLPIVTGVTQHIGLAQQYDALAQKAQALGLVQQDASIEHHVTTKALDGLYLMIADEEKRIRTDPAGTGSALLKKVFGAL